jgi:hypothetical protein
MALELTKGRPITSIMVAAYKSMVTKTAVENSDSGVDPQKTGEGEISELRTDLSRGEIKVVRDRFFLTIPCAGGDRRHRL